MGPEGSSVAALLLSTTHGPRFYPHYLKRGDVKEPGVVAVPPCGNSVQDDEAGR